MSDFCAVNVIVISDFYEILILLEKFEVTKCVIRTEKR